MTQAAGQAITVADLTKRFDAKVAVGGISFSVPTGSIFGFLGPNGAGKTTTIKMLLGLLRPSSGTIEVLGRQVPRDVGEIRRHVGVLFDNSGVYDRLTVLQNLRFFAEAYGVPTTEWRSRATELLQWLGIEHLLEQRVALLSTGERRKLGVARVFIHQPKLIFLDEPTLGLDIESRLSLWAGLRGLAKQHGSTVFLTTHYLEEVERLCDRVLVLKDGRVVADSTPAALALDSRKPIVTVRLAHESDAAVAIVRALPGVSDACMVGPEIQVTFDAAPDNAALVQALVSAGEAVVEVRSDEGRLERAFVELIKGGIVA